MKTKKQKIITIIISVIALVCAYLIRNASVYTDPLNVPEFSGVAYVPINGNQPDFADTDLVTQTYEFYSELDELNRCGYVMACIGVEIMPTEERGSIGQVKPTGWHTVKYDFVDGKYLYNRCHLIGYQLTGENANERNLITGTRYLNIEGMLPFENMVADYVQETGNHVIYRVTPHFKGNDLLAHGVQLEGYSVEDNGDGICFNVYTYNAQPGVTIDYATGDSWIATQEVPSDSVADEETTTYILNTSSKKFHSAQCGQAEEIAKDNKEETNRDREALIAEGYVPAQCCDP